MQLTPNLEKTFKLDKQYLEETELPIVTVSASFKEDLKGLHGLPETEEVADIVFSRAHYSMALAIAAEAWGTKLDPKKAWIVDPTNYVSHKNWKSIQLTEVIGKTLARHPILKAFKDLVDKFGRSKLPILGSITPPLLHITKDIKSPILSFHIAAGNILASQGKKIIQVITDPHVRDEYLKHAGKLNIKFCVFDGRTKTEFLEKAAIMGQEADPNQVIVTGPPVDPRIIEARTHKKAWRSGPLNLCLSTGGLGTNKKEIRKILEQLLPLMRKRPSPIKLALYAGTQQDIYEMGLEIAKEEHIEVQTITKNKQIGYFPKKESRALDKHKFSIIYNHHIVDANELLTYHAFHWADGFISKPSGDMAYDAIASGSFLLTLEEWGEWENNIREVFSQKEVSRRAETDHIVEQIEALTDTRDREHSWVERAMNNAFNIEPLFIKGAENIIKVVQGEEL